jgi:DNA polymerase II small subunit
MKSNKEKVDLILENGYLVSKDFIEKISDDFEINYFLDKINNLEEKPFILTSKILSEFQEKKEIGDRLKILKNYGEESKKRSVQDFVDYFKLKYESVRDILIKRKELENVISINKIGLSREREDVSLIGMVVDKNYTKTRNILIKLEDLTGLTNILISKNKKELYEIANDLVLDEVIGVSGVTGDRIIFVNDLFFPDVPVNNKLKKSGNDDYVVFTSDLHTGSKKFFKDNFLKLIDWLNCKNGDEKHKEIASKVKYLFILGDLVDGVGIYPGHDEDLEILDIYEQYKVFTEMIGKIRKDIIIILIGGNHDALRISEPQPVISKKIAGELLKLENVYFLSNPALVNIGSYEGFEGFKVLLYHGLSIPYFAENVESIRQLGKLERVDLVMKFLLQKRHLAPTHTSNLYVPNNKEDPLFIKDIPDFFVTGHIHKILVSNYRNITMIAGGCWIGRTADQERRGIMPEPNKVVLVNLKTRNVKILNFEDEKGIR